MNFKKLFKVIFVDCMALFVGVISGFLLPKFLNLESYAYIKTFTLYIGYSGMFHFGFSDGMYILLGGKNIGDIKKEKVKGYIIVLLKILLLSFLILICLNLFIIKDIIFTYFMLYTVPFQITLFMSLLYRATGELDRYVILRGVINIFSLISILGTISVFKSPISYIIVQILGYTIIASIYLIKIFLNKINIEKIRLNEIKFLISTGFIIMIANTINNLLFSLDRWFIKFRFDNTEFAYYSFGVSMLTLFTTLIGSITVVFYSYLAKNSEDEIKIKKIKEYIILICSFAPAGYFILDLIIRLYIPNYIKSLDVLGILILSIPFMTIINVIYSNLYKVNNKGKKYLIVAIKILIVSISLNLLVLNISIISSSIAYATLASLIIWYVYSSMHFKALQIEVKELIYFSIYLVSYMYIKNIQCNSILKSVIFSIVILVNIAIFYKKEFIELINFILKNNKNISDI